MTLPKARSVLQSGADIADMAEAIAVIVSDPSSSEADIRLGLRHPGFIAEQAEFALRRRGFDVHGCGLSDAALPTAASEPSREII
jgi:hypothetical protein